MKKMLCFLPLLCILIIASCNQIKNPQYEYVTVISADAKDILDIEHTHLPTDEEVNSITSGMKMREVIGILGLPHQGGPTSGVNSLLWYTDGGNVMWVTLSPSDEHDAQCSQKTDLIDYLECQYNCWVVGKPHIVSATDYVS